MGTFQKKKVVVFCATGEIGGRITLGCHQAGHDVVGVSRGVNKRHIVNLDGIKFEYGDKNSEEFLCKLKSKYSFDVVIDTSLFLDGMKLLQKHFSDVENIITCSSVGTYAPLLAIPADESNPWRENTGANFYWQSERDAWAIDRCKEKGDFPITILRPTLITGYGRIPLDLWGGRNIDFWKMLRDNKTVAVPEKYDKVLIQSACNDDLATAFVKAVDKGKSIHGEIFIITCKQSITLKRYLEIGMKALNSTSKIEPVSKEELISRYGDEIIREKDFNYLMEHNCFSIEKAEKLLGYTPVVSPEKSLTDALKWCKEESLL